MTIRATTPYNERAGAVDAPFVAVNLVESTLFGHEKGALDRSMFLSRDRRFPLLVVPLKELRPGLIVTNVARAEVQTFLALVEVEHRSCDAYQECFDFAFMHLRACQTITDFCVLGAAGWIV